MSTGAPTPSAGWYPDPQGGGGVRYWDGRVWTEHVSSAAAPPAGAGNGMAVAALVLGIVGCVLCWVPVLGLILGVLGIVFGALGRKRAQREPGAGKGTMALSGLILGIIATVLSVLLLFVLSSAINRAGHELRDLTHCLNDATTQAEREACTN